MRVQSSLPVLSALILTCGVVLVAHQPVANQGAAPKPRPQDTEVWEPVVTPGPSNSAPPSDAVVLFDGRNLDEWINSRDKSAAGWTVANGMFTVNKQVGNIETKRTFRNYQLHIEWLIPEHITGEGQARGNSGVFLASTGGGDARRHGSGLEG